MEAVPVLAKNSYTARYLSLDLVIVVRKKFYPSDFLARSSCCYLLQSVFVVQAGQNGACYYAVTPRNTVT
jgi:hypothetical protein